MDITATDYHQLLLYTPLGEGRVYRRTKVVSVNGYGIIGKSQERQSGTLT